MRCNAEDEPEKWPAKKLADGSILRINPLICYQLQDASIAAVERAEKEATAAIEKARAA